MAATGATAVALAPITRPRIQPDVVDRSPPTTGVRFAFHPPSLTRRSIHLNLPQVTTESTRATVRSRPSSPQPGCVLRVFLRGSLAELVGAGCRVTASFGVATLSREGSSARFLKACESAVEPARTDGADRVVHLEVAAEDAALA